ncbi:MAG: branched-chain amino acid aminotransferase [Flavobacteriaceae bacterium]|nr:branched-chain amino acid aminotransferase [Bacteroidia bacterium]MBT8286442.1 branched-chain amino acid aminotransferase [Bacteroidia bacterium]NNF75718.1 branched-chain amino acid aminotransferase [Flavobacteriaceae bacterium]NNK74265.1 branched-chain amino acid aminotransferase [Flavobacteriaceae bacterium]
MIYEPKCKIDIEIAADSQISAVDFENIEFGKIFTDHLFECDFKNGAWQTPKIRPYGPISLDPGARVFHYGQAVFEGMKAYKDDDGGVWLFRPEENFKRINKSAKRLAIPEFPENYFFEGMKTLIQMDSSWVKSGLDNSLYIRPYVIATEAAIAAAPSKEYKFVIMCSPAKAYYKGKVKVVFAEQYSRAADGGVGFAKAAGNYAAQFYPTNLANEKGFQQIIWTDANTHEYLEEAGTMNIFFRIGDRLLTAPTNDRILDGVTRKSIIQLAEDFGIPCEVRPVTVKEIKDAARTGELKEIFGAGTAAVVSPISAFEHKGELFELEDLPGSFADKFKNRLVSIQHNAADDEHGWRYRIK